MTKDELPIFAKKVMRHFLNDFGELIYSSHDTLREGDVYLLGLNPGGAGHTTINNHIDLMLTRTENSYVDEAWTNNTSSYRKGEAPLQKRVAGLIHSLGYDIRNVCASNLIFKTTPSSDELCFGLAGLCWQFHEELIELIKPKLILTFGNSKVSPYAFLKALFYRESSSDEQVIAAGHGEWSCKGFHALVNGRKTFIVGLPHMSYYNPLEKPFLTDWLTSNIDITKTWCGTAMQPHK